MRVIITGSRFWEHGGHVFNILDHLKTAHGDDLTVVHGACPTGADWYTEVWCRRNDHTPVRFPAEWGKHRRGAGPIRNRDMVNAGADLVIAFPNPVSEGTWHCMDTAAKAGITVINLGWKRPYTH